MKKKIMFLLVGLIFITGCSKSNKEEAVKYTIDDVPIGYFVKKGDSFYPLVDQGMSTTNEGMFQWFTEPFDEIVPIFEEGDELVYISDTERPLSYEFYRMIDYGYTIGAQFNLNASDSDGGWGNTTSGGGTAIKFPDSGGYNELSPISEYAPSVITKPAATKIVEVNSKEAKASMFTREGFMLGLTKDAFYKFNYYSGTIFSSINLKADTHLFIQEDDGVFRTTSHTEQRDLYFTINLPQTMDNGFYVVEGSGLFEYQASSDLNNW